MNKQNQPQTAVGLLTEATLKAAIEIAIAQGLYQNPKSDFADKFTEAIKSTLKSNLERVMSEWQEATEANLSNTWLQKLMRTQAVELAREAVDLLA